jgi:hypothetical protein
MCWRAATNADGEHTTMVPLLVLLLLLQAALFDKVQAHTDELVDAGPVPGIESFCIYSKRHCGFCVYSNEF